MSSQKTVTPVKTGRQKGVNHLISQDSKFKPSDEKGRFLTFCATIHIDTTILFIYFRYIWNLKSTIIKGKREVTGMAYEPSDREDEYFMKLDQERLANMRSELDQQRKEQSNLHRKDTHWMKCPKCGRDLEEINYQNVMIDRCPDCKGVWLDHGELELLGKGDAKVTKGLLEKIFG